MIVVNDEESIQLTGRHRGIDGLLVLRPWKIGAIDCDIVLQFE